MTRREFQDAIETLHLRFAFSETSGFRTRLRNDVVGGVANSYHLSGRAVDIIADISVDMEALIGSAQGLGLEVIHESDHLHLEPRA